MMDRLGATPADYPKSLVINPNHRVFSQNLFMSSLSTVWMRYHVHEDNEEQE